MARKPPVAEQRREDMQFMRTLNAGYEGALCDIKGLLSSPGFNLEAWLDARLSLVRSQL